MPVVGANNIKVVVSSCKILFIFSLRCCGVLPAHLFPPLSSEPAIWGLSYCGWNEIVKT